MLEDFYSDRARKGPSSDDEYDFELSTSNERVLTEEKDGKRTIKVCTGVPHQSKFGKTFSAFEKKPLKRKIRSSIVKTSQENESSSLPDERSESAEITSKKKQPQSQLSAEEEDESTAITQKSESYESLNKISREPTAVLDEEESPQKRKRKSQEGDKKVLRTPPGKAIGKQRRRLSRSPQSSASSSLANLSWDNESEDEPPESLIIESNNEKDKTDVEKVNAVNPSTYTEIIELAGMSQIVDDLKYAFDGFDNAAVKNDCCIQILELCCQNSESIGLIFRSKNFFAKLFDSVMLADNDVFELGIVSVFFVLLSGDNHTNNNSFYFNDDRAIQLMVKILSKQNTLSGSQSVSKAESSDSILTPSKKRKRRGSLLDSIRSGGTKIVSQSESVADVDPNVVEIKKLLSPFPAFEGIPPEKITPEYVATECLSILSASLANRNLKNVFIRLGANSAIESTLLIHANSSWASNTHSIRLLESCMSYVENAAYMNTENQSNLIVSGKLIPGIIGILRTSLESDDEPKMEKTILTAMKALINLVERSEPASKQCADAGIFEALTKEFKMFVSKTLFDHSVLTVVLMINLTETSRVNRVVLGQDRDFIPTLSSMYRKAGVFSGDNESQVFSAYCAVLLGCLSKDVPENARAVIQNGIYFDELSACVTEFVTFQSDAGILSTQARDSYLGVIETFQKLDYFYKTELKATN